MTVLIQATDGHLIRSDTAGRMLVDQVRTTVKEGGRGESKPMIRVSTPPFGATDVGRPADGTDAQTLMEVFAARVAEAESGIWGIRNGVIYCTQPLNPATSRTFPLTPEATAPEEKK